MISDNLRRLKQDLAEVCAKSERRPEDITEGSGCFRPRNPERSSDFSRSEVEGSFNERPFDSPFGLAQGEPLEKNSPRAHITIVAVTKYVGIDKIREAVNCGIKDFGENRLQEALSKYQQIRDLCKLHMIGHLQTNKVKKAVELFDMIQSVDSIKLTQEINKHSKAVNKVMDVLIEVNTSAEATKCGIKPEETLDFLRQIKDFTNIRIKGLMTIGPLSDNPEDARPCFRLLRTIFEEANNKPFADSKLTVLSMGMSDDYKIAVEEGSNMIRVGRILFNNVNSG